MTDPKHNLSYGDLNVAIFETETALGQAAAAKFAADVGAVIKKRGSANAIIATGNSQLAFFRALRERTDIDWVNINIFHMDEYVGMSESHSASFRGFAKREIVEPLGAKAFFGIEGDAADPEKAAKDYAVLLEQYPPRHLLHGHRRKRTYCFQRPAFRQIFRPRNGQNCRA